MLRGAVVIRRSGFAPAASFFSTWPAVPNSILTVLPVFF